MDAITLTREQWDRLVALIDELDSAWNMTADRRDVGQWTVEERYDRLEQASFAALNAQLLINEIEATR